MDPSIRPARPGWTTLRTNDRCRSLAGAFARPDVISSFWIILVSFFIHSSEVQIRAGPPSSLLISSEHVDSATQQSQDAEDSQDAQNKFWQSMKKAKFLSA